MTAKRLSDRFKGLQIAGCLAPGSGFDPYSGEADAATVDAQVSEALRKSRYDVIVIGAGLRTLPPMTEQFERLINVLHEKAPQAKLAFNSQPADSDKAALRWLPTSPSPSE